jgi:hypothetical protein
MQVQFWIGLTIGLFTGGAVTALMLAVCAMAKGSDPRASEIIDLNNGHGIVPGD